jgi:hypothetical protein
MDTTIQLNGQLGLYTEEIQHIGTERVLPSEFDPLLATVP